MWRSAIRSTSRISSGGGKPSTPARERQVDRAARGALRGREAAVQARSRALSARSARGKIHGGVRWKRWSCATRGDLGHELDRRRAGADHRDALAREVVVVVPVAPSGTRSPAKLSSPGISGIAGSLSAPDAGDETWRVNEPPPEVSRRQQRRRLVPRGLEHLVAEADVRAQPEACRRSRAR